jgi:hypothetical protein
MRKYIKDPDAVLDYTYDWSSFLADGEVIVEHEIFLSGDDITLDVSTADNTTVTVWLSGGIVREYYYITCRITTDQGRVDNRSIWILIKKR